MVAEYVYLFHARPIPPMLKVQTLSSNSSNFNMATHNYYYINE